jgi:endonuclease/exonuclease/phosphatase family metal-dependent hydrolase
MELVDKNTHGHFFYFNTHFAHDSDSARIMSSKILLKEVGNISEDFPFIITGDFNMLPSSKGYAILTGPDESVPTLKDSYLLLKKDPMVRHIPSMDFPINPVQEELIISLSEMA